MKVYVVEVRSRKNKQIDGTVSCVVSSIENAISHMKRHAHSMSVSHWWCVYSQMVDGGSVCEEILYFDHLGEPRKSQL
jgi:hypothetical protein